MRKNIAIIIPCFNEEESLPYLFKAIDPVKKSIEDKYRADLIFINDGSTDMTQNKLIEFSKGRGDVFYREFAYNAGHQNALRAGISIATTYDAAIMLDADLQHPPELIPKMLEQWQAGNQIVQMTRKDSSKDVGLLKYTTSKIYYYLINKLSDLNLEYGASDFRLIDQQVIKAVAGSREQDLFLRGFFSWLKVPRSTIEYKPHERIAGASKYTLRKMFELAYKGILQFSERPLRIAVSLGATLSLLSFIYGVILIARYTVGSYVVSGWTSLMVVLLFFFGINFVLLGIIGIYLAHLIHIEKERPEYIIISEKLPHEA